MLTRSNTLIIRITGGLGNQLFQYALGRNISMKNGMDLVLDTTELKNNTRRYTLNVFNIKEKIGNETDLRNIGLPNMESGGLYHRVIRKFFRKSQGFLPLKKRRFILEPYFQFCPEILKISKSCYLTGVWQTEKYFKEIEDVIRQEITLKIPTSQSFKTWSAEILKHEAISLHVRRGDYVSNQRTNKFHGICGIDYYDKAVATMKTRSVRPVFFIFSDDIDWAKQNIRLDHPVFYISSTGTHDYEELMLMAACKHNVIANSSFSWWGAWLNGNREKIVVAPRRWFNTDIDTADLIPETWIQL